MHRPGWKRFFEQTDMSFEIKGTNTSIFKTVYCRPIFLR